MSHDWEALVCKFRMPDLGTLREEASTLSSRLRKQLSDEFRTVEKGSLYSEWQKHFNTLSVRLFRNPGMPLRSLDQSMLCRLAGATTYLLHYVDAKVDVTYTEEANPIDGTTIAPRTLDQSISLQELFENHVKVFRGSVESVTFTGYYKTQRSRKTLLNDKIVDGLPSGLYVPAVFAFYAHSEDAERVEDRLFRMKLLCCEGDTLSLCRNLNGLLNKCTSFTDAQIKDPARPIVEVCGTSTKLTVYLLNRHAKHHEKADECREYHKYQWQAGDCNKKQAPGTCVIKSPKTEGASFGKAQAFRIEQC